MNVNKISRLVKRYNKSTKAIESFEKFQAELGLPKHGLLQRVKTRWNSDFIMLERAVEQKQAIVAECTAAGEDHLTIQEWKLAEGFVEVLRPLADHTNDMGSENMPTASIILPTIFEITSYLQEFIRTAPRGTGIQFARQVLSNLQKRFEYYKDNETLRISTLIDPRAKDTLEDDTVFPAANVVLEEKAQVKYRSGIRRGLVQNVPAAVSPPTDEAAGTSSTNTLAPVQPATKKTKWKHLQIKSARNNSDLDDVEHLNKIKDKVKSYLLLPNIEAEENPLKWWKANQSLFPNLALVARHYLAIAATEAPSERVASTGSNVCTPKRTNLSSEHLKELVFLHDNLKLPVE